MVQKTTFRTVTGMKTSEHTQNNLAPRVYRIMAKEVTIKDFCGVTDPNFSPIIENHQWFGVAD
jgi:hypothetical protein